MVRRQILVFSAIAALMTSALPMGKDFWEKPYTEWKKGDVLKMLNDSPWARSQTVADTTGEKVGVRGEREQFNMVIARFFSSLPIRAAYVRQLQIMNSYDEKTPAEKAQIDEKFSRVLKLDFSKNVMVALDFKTSTSERKMDVDRYLANLKAEQLKQSCYLISDRLGRITIAEYYPPSADGTGAKFVFPREQDGKPILLPEDKELKFDFWFEAVEQKVFITFKVKNMMFDGKLEF